MEIKLPCYITIYLRTSSADNIDYIMLYSRKLDHSTIVVHDKSLSETLVILISCALLDVVMITDVK